MFIRYFFNAFTISTITAADLLGRGVSKETPRTHHEASTVK
jgi:hypothetical protein